MTQAATEAVELDPRSPRARLTKFFDNGEFTLITPEDDRGVVSAVGRANGTHVVAFATDPTVQGGAMGNDGCRAIVTAYDRAFADSAPVVGLWHSGGARLREGVLSLDGVGRVFAAMTRASGKVPQISVVLGPAAGGRSEHHGDLGHLAGCTGHGREDAADAVEAEDALAQTCAAGVPQAHHGSGVREGAVIGGDDGAAAVVAHGAALHRRVRGERDDVRAVRAPDRRHHAAVVLGGDEGELTVVEELRQASPRRAGVELDGLGGCLRHVTRS